MRRAPVALMCCCHAPALLPIVTSECSPSISFSLVAWNQGTNLVALTGLSTTEPSSADGNSSGLEEDEEELGRGAEAQVVPQTPDQEAFLKEHFVTLAELSNPGSLSSVRTNQRVQMFRPS